MCAPYLEKIKTYIFAEITLKTQNVNKGRHDINKKWLGIKNVWGEMIN